MIWHESVYQKFFVVLARVVSETSKSIVCVSASFCIFIALLHKPAKEFCIYSPISSVSGYVNACISMQISGKVLVHISMSCFGFAYRYICN